MLPDAMADALSDALPDVPAGAVELREDVPLKSAEAWGVGPTGRTGCCAEWPRLALATFALLSAGITLALITQLYFENYEPAAHGAVSSSAGTCSAAGADALKAGGRAIDAAAVTALCLAVVAPHVTSIDASGSLVYWEYRRKRTQSPLVVEWGPSTDELNAVGPRPTLSPRSHRPPRLLFALATLHARFGALPWPRLLQPALRLATEGFPVSEALAAALPGAGERRSDPALAMYLNTLQHNSSTELSGAWARSGGVVVRERGARLGDAGSWRVVVGGVRAAAVERALRLALGSPSANDVDANSLRASLELQRAVGKGGAGGAEAAGGSGSIGSTASGLAVVDPFDTYLALVTGLSVPFGSASAAGSAGVTGGKDSEEGWTHDEPRAPLDLAPAIMVDQHVCGTRFVIGAESSAALAQAGVAIAWEGAGGVERERTAAGKTHESVNVVQQRGDALLSHADSRGGGIASRF